MCSKSANYCFVSPSRKEGLLVLCDVALGQTNDLLAADYSSDELPRGKHSTRGLGRVAPDPAQQETLYEGEGGRGGGGGGGWEDGGGRGGREGEGGRSGERGREEGRSGGEGEGGKGEEEGERERGWWYWKSFLSAC